MRRLGAAVRRWTVAVAALVLGAGALAAAPADAQRWEWATFTDRLGCAKGMKQLFTYAEVPAAYAEAKPRFTTTQGDSGLPPATGEWSLGPGISSIYVNRSSYTSSTYSPLFRVAYLEPYMPPVNTRYTLTLTLPAATRLQFSVADMDDGYGYEVTGLLGTTPVKPTGYAHNPAGVVISYPKPDTVRVWRGSWTDLSDLDERAVGDIAFLRPVDKVLVSVVRDNEGSSGSNTMMSPYVCTPDTKGSLVVGTPAYAGPQPTGTGTGAAYDVPVELRLSTEGAPVSARVEDDLRARIEGGPVPGKVESITAGPVTGEAAACRLNPAWLDGSSVRVLDAPAPLLDGRNCVAKMTARVSYQGRVPTRPWSKEHSSSVFADAAATTLLDGPRAERTTYAPPAGLVTRPPR
ncbi:hypothetical protein GCM10010329_19580 [Streptomyces spiroverticillatus]|uniref:Uncharacterized protein n=1 Tax=Streptomyces finlayi TaxID=67296 RepID=A0A918WUN7_9ACTN|nr:hypothetical protein [Streptomyces finlayi]GGZ98242.1 hypothetical protein GCM10010329_19580 [Streptomyces spiroverticillatus]GHC83176.1 hypothetical protein GCM10010334_12020 [Streptomyces finlayi]